MGVTNPMTIRRQQQQQKRIYNGPKIRLAIFFESSQPWFKDALTKLPIKNSFIAYREAVLNKFSSTKNDPAVLPRFAPAPYAHSVQSCIEEQVNYIVYGLREPPKWWQI
jgi:hypothetical protein